MGFTPQDRTFSHHWPREVVTLDRILHSPLCLPIRDHDKFNTHNKHISDKQTLMTVCVRNGTPFDGVHAPQSRRFRLGPHNAATIPTPFSFRCGHATSTSHRIKFTYNILMFATVFVVHAKRHARQWGSHLRIEPFHTTGRVK